MTLPAPIRPDDPSLLSWPATLPIEVALQTAGIKQICEAYNLSRDDWDNLRLSPRFQEEVARISEELKKDGMTFRMKARLQAEEMLKQSWKMVHDTSGIVPPSVKADLIKFTVRAAGLEASKDALNGNQNNLNIQINLG